MKEKQVHFYLKESTDPKSKDITPIFVNFSYHRVRLRMSTGISIAPNNWDFKTKFPKKSFADYLEYKETLNTFEKDILQSYKSFTDKGIIPSAKSLKESIQSRKTLKHESEILDFKERYTEFLTEKGLDVKELTLKKYKTLIDLIKEFESNAKYPIRFDTIDSNFEKRFKIYLTGTKKHQNDTVSKYLECLKVYMEWALHKGLHQTTFFKNFKTPKTKPAVIYLTYNELMLLSNLDLEGNERLSKVRDIFCFQCFTGQRFSDISNLRWKELIKFGNNEFEWHLFQQKGNKPTKVEIPILPEPLAILQRQNKTGTLNDYVFEKISNQKLNAYLKELCKLAGINERIVDRRYSGKKAVEKSGPKYKFISTHSARKTYVTVSHQRGMDYKAIMDITGHQDARTMNRYLGSSKLDTFEQMKKAWSK